MPGEKLDGHAVNRLLEQTAKIMRASEDARVEKLCRAAYDLGRHDATDDISGAWPVGDFSMDRVRQEAERDA
jgi:hypothetical protein